jgi:hypothetical protein
MSVHRSSRYLRQPKLQVVDDRGGTQLVYEQRDTTVFEADLPRGTRTFLQQPGSSFPSISKRFLGRQQFWWIVADCNPEIFYPLDLVDAVELRVPPKDSPQRFQRRK